MKDKSLKMKYQRRVENVFDVDRIVQVPRVFGQSGEERRPILPLEHFRRIRKPLLLAATTTSSSSTVAHPRHPLAQQFEKCVRNGVDQRIGIAGHSVVHRLVDPFRHRRQPMFEHHRRAGWRRRRRILFRRMFPIQFRFGGGSSGGGGWIFRFFEGGNFDFAALDVGGRRCCHHFQGAVQQFAHVDADGVVRREIGRGVVVVVVVAGQYQRIDAQQIVTVVRHVHLVRHHFEMDHQLAFG